MKILLITFNLILTVFLVWGSVKFFRNIRSAKPEAGFTVKKRVPGAVKVKKETPPVTPPAAEAEVVLPLSAQVDAIIKTNIFNQERCPNSGAFGNTRVELTLVGTFKIGTTSGAIILQKSQTRNQPFMPFGMNPGQQDLQQRQMGIGQRPGMNGNTGTPPTQGTVNTRRQTGGARSIQANRSATGNNAQGTTGTTTPQQNYKQYVRLGETLSNGYKLVEVERNRVVLTRGSDKLELELADASKNAPQSTGAARTAPANQTQVMQQMLNSMQQMQMMQGFQMMRMGQQGQQPEAQPPQSTGRSGTAARSRR